MSEYGGGHPTSAHPHAKSPISVPWVVGAALLIGLGVFAMAYFLLTFNLLYFFGIGALALGGLMLFSRRAGVDSA